MPKTSSLGAQPERRFDRDLDQMRGALARLPGAAARIGARDVEVAQDDVIGARARVAASRNMISVISFDQPYGEIGCVGASSLTGISCRIAVDRGGRGKDEVPHAVLDGAFDQRARVGGVVAIVAERIATPSSGTTIEAAKWMMAVDAVLGDDAWRPAPDRRCRRRRAARPSATAQRNPVDRLSSTTTRFAGIDSSSTMWLPM